MTTKENSHKNNNRSQTRESGYGSNKGHIMSMAVIVGIGLALMIAASSSMLNSEALGYSYRKITVVLENDGEDIDDPNGSRSGRGLVLLPDPVRLDE